MLPISVQLRGRLCLVVGAGPVGLRKVHSIREAGGQVRLVAPNISGALPPQIEWLATTYRTEHLDGVLLVFAASLPEVNAQVVLDATARGLLVNSATDPHRGDFTLPAVARRDQLTLAVSTDGASPTVARTVCDALASQFDATFSTWLTLLQQFRELIRERITNTQTRQLIQRDLADLRWLERLRTIGEPALRAEWESRLNQLADGEAGANR